MDIHPWPEVTEIIPPLSQQERQVLAESIQKDGVRIPILVLPDGRIVDGYHRWLLSSSQAPVEVLKDKTDAEALALAINLNIARRQLSSEQIVLIRERQRKLVQTLRQEGRTQVEVASVIGISPKTVDNWESESNSNGTNTFVPPDIRVTVKYKEYHHIAQRVAAGESRVQVAADFKVTPQRIGQIIDLVDARNRIPVPVENTPLPQEHYRCLVIDPPWPMEKIEREVRPHQGQSLDYTTMSIEEIKKLPIPDLADKDGCHVYLWVTHRFLPDGLSCFESWGVKYQCVLTWVKNVGFTPFSFMYSTEHVLFGRIGSLKLLRLGIRLDFNAPVEGHSVKPETFYDIVRTVSPEPRLDMFSRRQIAGFTSWGAEAPKEINNAI